jgi:hypothetical protein
LSRHIREARQRKTHRHHWIAKLEDAGKQPVFTEIERTSDWAEAEVRWIAYYKAQGCGLVNGNKGGVCMKQARDKEGLWPNYKRAMCKLGQDRKWLEKNLPNSPVIAKSRIAQDRLKDAAKIAKARGTMGLLDAKLGELV